MEHPAIALSVKNLTKVFNSDTAKLVSVKDLIKDIFKPKKAKSEPYVALQDISFDVKRGSTVGIIGQNGAGKSTLLRILAGITQPSSGSIYIDGQTSSVLDIGSGVHPELNGIENIYYNAQLLGVSKVEIVQKIQQIIDFSELHDYMHMPVKHFSSGMFLRLAFSIAVHFNQDIILFDEVLAVGDIKFQEKCISKIYDLKNEGKTIIVVSHNLSQVINLCDEVLVLEKGQLIDRGEPYGMVKKYVLRDNVHQESPAENIDEQAIEAEVDTFDALAKETHDSAQDRVFNLVDCSFTVNQIKGTDLRVRRGDNLNLNIVFDIHTPGLELEIALLLTNVTGNHLLAYHSLGQEEPFKNTPGTYQTQWDIKTDIFNFGTYFVELFWFSKTKNIGNKIVKIALFEIEGELERVGNFVLDIPLKMDYEFHASRVK